MLSYTVSTRNRFGFQNVTHNLMDKTGEFPSGNLYLVEQWLRETTTAHSIVDSRVKPKLNPLNLKTLFTKPLDFAPYPEQVAAANAVLSGAGGLSEGRGTIVAPTGLGKTLIISLICDLLKVPTLIAVPSLQLKHQLTETLRSYFGHARVGPLHKGKVTGPFIAVENYDALVAKPLQGYDCVIIDEFHHAASQTLRTMNDKSWQNVYYRIGLTATNMRSREEEKLLLESVLSNVIYEITYETAVAKGYICPVEAYFYTIPKEKLKCNGKSYAGVYGEVVVSKAIRSEIIATILQNLHSAGQVSLCLVREIKHGEILSKLTGCAFANGKSDDCQDLLSWLSSGKLKTLVATSGVAGEGCDTRAVEWVVIASPGKSQPMFQQQVGRALRKYPGKETGKIIIFKDASHRWTLDHFNQQRKYLRDCYGVDPIELDLPEGFT